MRSRGSYPLVYALNKSRVDFLDRDSIERCRECMWFDPAYDQCPFCGAVRVDDQACVEFQPIE